MIEGLSRADKQMYSELIFVKAIKTESELILERFVWKCEDLK